MADCGDRGVLGSEATCVKLAAFHLRDSLPYTKSVFDFLHPLLVQVRVYFLENLSQFLSWVGSQAPVGDLNWVRG